MAEELFDEIPDDFTLDWVKFSDNKLRSDQVTSSDQVDPTANLKNALQLEFFDQKLLRIFKNVLDHLGLQTFQHRAHYRELFWA